MKKDDAKWPSPRPSGFAVAAWAVLAVIAAVTLTPLRTTPGLVSSLLAAIAIGISYLPHTHHESVSGQWVGIIASTALLSSSLPWVVMFAAILLGSEILWTTFSSAVFVTGQIAVTVWLAVGGLILATIPFARHYLDAGQPSPTIRTWALALRSAALFDVIILVGIAPLIFWQGAAYVLSGGEFIDATYGLPYPIIWGYLGVLAVVVFLIAIGYARGLRKMRAIASRPSAVTPANSPE